jgi:hypothetical protein
VCAQYMYVVHCTVLVLKKFEELLIYYTLYHHRWY